MLIPKKNGHQYDLSANQFFLSEAIEVAQHLLSVDSGIFKSGFHWKIPFTVVVVVGFGG